MLWICSNITHISTGLLFIMYTTYNNLPEDIHLRILFFLGNCFISYGLLSKAHTQRYRKFMRLKDKDNKKRKRDEEDLKPYSYVFLYLKDKNSSYFRTISHYLLVELSIEDDFFEVMPLYMKEYIRHIIYSERKDLLENCIHNGKNAVIVHEVCMIAKYKQYYSMLDYILSNIPENVFLFLKNDMSFGGYLCSTLSEYNVLKKHGFDVSSTVEAMEPYGGLTEGAFVKYGRDQMLKTREIFNSSSVQDDPNDDCSIQEDEDEDEEENPCGHSDYYLKHFDYDY